MLEYMISEETQPFYCNIDTNPVKKYKDTFKNNRSQYYTELSRRFYNTYLCRVKGKYIDPAEMISLNLDGIDDIITLRSELCQIPLKDNGQGLIQIMSKNDMKRLGIKSPNMADSIMMSMFMPPIIKVKPKIVQPAPRKNYWN